MSAVASAHPERRSADPQFFPEAPLWTPEIGRKSAIVATWVANDEPGGHLWGIQGAGKSQFAEYMLAVVPTMLGGTVTAFLWSFLGFKPKNAEELLKHCMVKTGCRAIGTRERPVLEMRFTDAILARLQASETNRALFILDEIQNISHELLGVLLSVTSGIQRMGFRTCLVSIGQPEMQQGIQLLHQTNALQMIWRLFPQTEIYQCLSLEDIKEFLANLDAEGQFTKQWFPCRSSSGWSIADLAEPINDAIVELLKERSITATARVPLGYLRPALNSMFRWHLNAEGDSTQFEATHAVACLKSVGFATVINRYVEVKK
jgi:hypothetical protein